MEEKACTKCQAVKSLDEFRPHPLGKGGRHSRCRECERIHARAYMEKARTERPDELREIKQRSAAKRRETISAKGKAYYQANREERLKQAAEYREKNRDYILAWHKRHYRENRDRRLAKDRDYNRRNAEKRSQSRKLYRELHRAEVRMRNRARKLRMKFSVRDYTHQDWLNCLAYWGDRCAICGRAKDDQRQICADHWLPLVGGGLTHRSNILPLCHGIDGCNNKKHDKNPIDWLVGALGEEQGRAKLAEIEAYFAGLASN